MLPCPINMALIGQREKKKITKYQELKMISKDLVSKKIHIISVSVVGRLANVNLGAPIYRFPAVKELIKL